MAGHASTTSYATPRPPDAVDGDAAVVRGDAAPVSRVPLSRERIVDAALEFIDDQGLPGLSMRRLGTHARGRGDGAVPLRARSRATARRRGRAHRRRRWPATRTCPSSPEHGWQDYLQRLAHGIRRVALAHPKAFPLVASRPAEAPWLRPPLRSLRWVEAFLDGLSREGFSDAAARGGVPGVHQLPARSPAARGRRTRRGPRAHSTSSMRRPTRRWARTPSSDVCGSLCTRTTPRPSSRTPWRTCCNASR